MISDIIDVVQGVAEDKVVKTLEISTYDFLAVTSLELQVSVQTVNSVARLAYTIFPDFVEKIDNTFVPNLWVNRILIQLPDSSFCIVDANIWHDVYYYLTRFSGIDNSFYKYPKTMPFDSWFSSKVDETPTINIDISVPYSRISKVLTREYIDINSRIQLALYTLNTFSQKPKNEMMQQLEQSRVSANVVAPPR